MGEDTNDGVGKHFDGGDSGRLAVRLAENCKVGSNDCIERSENGAEVGGTVEDRCKSISPRPTEAA